MNNLKESLPYKKLIDSIVEIEVAVQRLKDNIDSESKNDNDFAEIVQIKKSLDKLMNYYFDYIMKLQKGG